MQFERQFNQTIDEPGIGESGGFPELRVHADGRETGNGVEFVDENFSGAAFEEEIAACHAGSIDRAKRANRVVLKNADLLSREWGGNHQPRAFFQVLSRVIVELTMRHNLAGNRSANVIIAQDRYFDLPPVDRTLHQDF